MTSDLKLSADLDLSQPRKPIPMLDLARQYNNINEEIEAAIKEVLASGHYINGPQVEQFEGMMREFLGVKHAIAVASGSDALLLCLQALGISCGDKVIVPGFTFFATAGAVSRLGAIPLFADINPDNYNIDISAVNQLLEQYHDVKAIIPVHLFGQPCNMKRIMRIAEQNSLLVIEDACQSIGASVNHPVGRIMVGTVGDAGCFSFFPSKNLGAYGDGGMVVTNDDETAAKIRMLRMHGAKPKYKHSYIGINSRLDTLQAAVLIVKMGYLEHWTRGRRRAAANYYEAFWRAGIKDQVKLPELTEEHVYNQFIIQYHDRDGLAAYLDRKGIASEVYYPIPLHLQECFSHLRYVRGSLPVAEKICRHVLALPIDPELSRDDISYIVNQIADYVNGKTG